MDDQLLPDLLRLRGSVVAASDEFFAAKENLTKAAAPVFVPDTYDAKGQVYDGWETRRRRGPGGKLPDRSARDWVIVRLGVPGVVRAIVVDTAFFTRNFPQACSRQFDRNSSMEILATGDLGPCRSDPSTIFARAIGFIGPMLYLDNSDPR